MEENDRLLLWIGYIGLSLVIFLLISVILVDKSEGNIVYQNLYSNDISLLASSILTSNGNLVVEYNAIDKPKEYDLEITGKCEVRISNAREEVSYKERICLEDKNIQIRENKINLDKLKLTLKNNFLSLEER